MKAVLLVLAAGLLTACAGTPVREQRYLLSLPAATVAPVSHAWAGEVVLRVEAVPDSIDRPELTLRLDPGTLEILEDARWAEPLRTGVERTLTESLARALPKASVGSTLPSGARPWQRVSVRIAALDVGPDGVVSLDARWAMRAADGPAGRSGQMRWEGRAASLRPSAIVVAWSQLLDVLAQRLAQQLTEQDAPRPP